MKGEEEEEEEEEVDLIFYFGCHFPCSFLLPDTTTCDNRSSDITRDDEPGCAVHPLCLCVCVDMTAIRFVASSLTSFSLFIPVRLQVGRIKFRKKKKKREREMKKKELIVAAVVDISSRCEKEREREREREKTTHKRADVDRRAAAHLSTSVYSPS
jgi:hypothetical protein